jgi:predicted small lipoprotein YifL
MMLLTEQLCCALKGPLSFPRTSFSHVTSMYQIYALIKHSKLHTCIYT